MTEHATEPPMAIWHNKFSVAPCDYDDITVSDKTKTYMECFSDQNWDWWPLNPPKRPIAPNKIRIQWQCVSFLRRNLSYETELVAGLWIQALCRLQPCAGAKMCPNLQAGARRRLFRVSLVLYSDTNYSMADVSIVRRDYLK